MKMYRIISHTITVLLLVLSYLFVVPREAYAYLDPGSGSYIFQIIIGTLLGGVFALKIYWKRIRKFFSNLLGGSKRRDEKS